jgi:pyruvate/2-oxoglutarate dehydrogenase complex dihydrolipoamide dehydrogenase (E3) component
VEWLALGDARHAVDGVVLALGRQPDPQLAFQVLCEQGFARQDSAFVPLRGANLETSVPGVYVVGDAAGLCTVAEALAEGRVAGRAAVGADTTEAVAALARLRAPERAAAVAELRLPADVAS